MTLTRQNKEKEREKIMKKNLNKLATLALTGAIVAGMSFGAMAQSVDSVAIKKVLETDGKTYAPNTTFTLSVTKGTLETDETTGAVKSDVYYTDKNGKKQAVKAYDLKNGTTEQAALIVVTGATYSAEQDGILTSDKNEKKITVNVKNLLTDENNKITTPGVYVFGVAETAVKYEGVEQGSDAPTQMMVVVNYNDEKRLEISSVLFAKDDGTKVDALTNYYGAKGEGDDKDKDKLYNLTLEKIVAGLGANMSQKFEFKVAVKPTNTEGQTSGTKEMYSYYAVNNNGESNELGGTIVATGADEAELKTESVGQLGNGDKIRIHGLSAGDEVTITETMPDGSDYVATYTVGGEKKENLEGIKLSTDTDVVVTNTKDQITVTGVAMNIAPYAAMVLGAGAFAGIFLGGKRRKAEDED